MTEQVAIKLDKGVLVSYESRSGEDTNWIVQKVNDDGTVQLVDVDNDTRVCLGVPLEHIKSVLGNAPIKPKPPVKCEPDMSKAACLSALEMVAAYIKSL